MGGKQAYDDIHSTSALEARLVVHSMIGSSASIDFFASP